MVIFASVAIHNQVWSDRNEKVSNQAKTDPTRSSSEVINIINKRKKRFIAKQSNKLIGWEQVCNEDE